MAQSQRGSPKKSKLSQHTGMMLGFWKLKVTPGIENIRNLPIWHA
jgi:hypothetical protein